MTQALTPQSPLMQPVQWQGQTYYLSQFFHRQYLAGSQYHGKHTRFDSFMRLLRSIEAYDIYIAQGDIVELTWTRMKLDQPTFCGSFKPLFQAAGWNPLTLLNATAQIALSHHLDDAISQQMSVAANTAIARQATRRNLATSTPVEIASREMTAWLQIGKLLGTPIHIVQQEAAKQIEATTGVNLRPLLSAAPAQNHIAPDEEMLEPADLAKQFGMQGGAHVNRSLGSIGWQVKRIGGDWKPTPAGEPYAARHAWTSQGGQKSGYNLKWQRQAVYEAFLAAGILQPPTEENQA